MTVRLLQIYYPWSDEGPQYLTAPLAALTALNVEFMRNYPGMPKLYESGIRYRREGKTRSGRQKEKWLTYPLMLMLKAADCEDLACARAAELRVAGIPAIAVARESSVGFHIVVQLPDGSIEDPSRKLGMGKE